jgi:hypothetical protein
MTNNTTSPAATRTTEMLLEQLQVVKLNIRLWTSSKKLRKEDLKLGTGATLPPETLASLGTKRTINPEQLNKFAAYKKEAERIVLATGTRFLGGFANPSGEIHRIVKELDGVARLFEFEKERFLTDYAVETEKWVNQHPQFADAIRRAIEPVGSVRNKLVFDYMIFRVSKPDDAVEDSLDRHTLSLGDQLFREIAQEGLELFDRSFSGKDSVTGRSLGAFNRMRKKLDNLGFLDRRSLVVVREIDRVLAGLPKSGPYTGNDFEGLKALALLLSDSGCIKQFGAGQTPVLPIVQPAAVQAPLPGLEPAGQPPFVAAGATAQLDIAQLIAAAQAPSTVTDGPGVASQAPAQSFDDIGVDDFLNGFEAFEQSVTSEKPVPATSAPETQQPVAVQPPVADAQPDTEPQTIRDAGPERVGLEPEEVPEDYIPPMPDSVAGMGAFF